jgi:hypothetical protein
VAERRLDNRYVSRSVAFTFADAGSTRTTSPVLFAHRAWEADSPLPVVIIVCALPDTPEARESFSLRFSGRVLSKAQLGGLESRSRSRTECQFLSEGTEAGRRRQLGIELGLQSEAGVGPHVVVVRPPAREFSRGLTQRGKPMTREALTSERAIEGFAHTVVDRLTRSAEVELDAIPVGPVIEGRRRALCRLPCIAGRPANTSSP